MSDKNFLSWVGFKGEDEGKDKPLNSSTSSLERIRELESQLQELRSRRDITALTKEEFEILATETAMSIIKTAQQRESKANSNAERVLNESKKSAAAAIESAEAKAKSTLSSAESRGRKYIEAAEADAADIIATAEREGEDLVANRKREANALTSSAKKEADRLVQSATTEVAEYRTWLSQVISEAERLYRIQSQSLDAAESAINQSRQRLDSAFTKLTDLQKQVTEAIRPDGTPTGDSKVAARIAAAQSNSGVAAKTDSQAPSGKKSSTKSKKKAGSKKAKSKSRR
ncbi:MAG: hypothetical protein EB044_03620 [Actinobacteria bacterium]|jgi:hypothetical protein|nr:hypothetical protein [Actinomycetota bacterium]NDA39423.1 hypothetical protein [Actinomycetota bacterium]NDE12729.1 hypothetical protein [Actinomycetota bacterium]NDE83835.1 hypothetical protein [Actinomycetota bacterium]